MQIALFKISVRDISFLSEPNWRIVDGEFWAEKNSLKQIVDPLRLMEIIFLTDYVSDGFAPHETRRSNMQISFQKNVQGMRNKMHNCQSFKSRVYINVITIVSALSVWIIDLFIEEQCS